jgi:oxepin-CoA hydrolase/3-oxo-5,6-dehydrosuberyl-CoA semialdehyde dehydrogenase
VRNSVPFNAEADSLNCAILGPDVTPDSEEFELFIKEVAREMTTKAGQKCTAIRRAIVPAKHIDAVATRLRERLRKVVVGDPSVEGVRMGALASHEQQRDVGERVRMLLDSCDQLLGASDGFTPVGDGVAEGAFFAPTLLLARDPHAEGGAHDIEAFGPVSTLMAYDDLDEALALAARGKGSLVATLVTADRRWPPRPSRPLLPGMAACWCSTAKRPRNPPATARRCRSSSTAARAAPAAVKSWAACARSSTTCNAPRCKVRRACWRR